MRVLAVAINGILDLKNMLPVSLELYAQHSIPVDVVFYRSDILGQIDHYDAIMVGSDWNQNRDLVERFNELGKKSILLQSEGMFLDNDQWYVRTVPVSKLLCLWGGVHKDIFRRRGYRGEISVTGAPRLDVYHKFNPSLSREEVYRRLSLDDIGRPYIVYLGQYFNEAEWGKELYEGQIALTEFACETPSEYYALVKCHPQEDKNNFFSREELCARRFGWVTASCFRKPLVHTLSFL